MRLYRTMCGQWVGTKDEARQIARKPGPENQNGWTVVDIPTDKGSLLAWLRENVPAVIQSPPAAAEAPADPISAPAIATGELSVATDEAFEALPLARQLHLAALALENARSQVKPC